MMENLLSLKRLEDFILNKVFLYRMCVMYVNPSLLFMESNALFIRTDLVDGVVSVATKQTIVNNYHQILIVVLIGPQICKTIEIK